MPELSTRLKMVADMVRKGSVAVDIGTDHAYLPVYLVLNNICPKALAADLRKGPLCNAKNHVDDLNLSDKIELILSDGFENINPTAIDDIMICGMGGTLIAEILSKAEWLKNPKYKLIIQPQSHPEEVRKYLINNGFIITEEKVCEDCGRDYIALSASYSGEIKQYSKPFIYFGNLTESENPTSKRIVKRTLKYLKEVENGERKYKSVTEADYYKEIIDETEEKINGNS